MIVGGMGCSILVTVTNGQCRKHVWFDPQPMYCWVSVCSTSFYFCVHILDKWVISVVERNTQILPNYPAYWWMSQVSPAINDARPTAPSASGTWRYYPNAADRNTHVPATISIRECGKINEMSFVFVFLIFTTLTSPCLPQAMPPVARMIDHWPAHRFF